MFIQLVRRHFGSRLIPNKNGIPAAKMLLRCVPVHLHSMACDSSFIVKSEWVLKVIGSHEQFKSGIILETLLYIDVVTSD